MAKVRLRGQESGSGGARDEEGTSAPIPLRPLAMAGVVISREVLVEALRVYVPQIETIDVFESGEFFVLRLRPANEGERPEAR